MISLSLITLTSRSRNFRRLNPACNTPYKFMQFKDARCSYHHHLVPSECAWGGEVLSPNLDKPTPPTAEPNYQRRHQHGDGPPLKGADAHHLARLRSTYNESLCSTVARYCAKALIDISMQKHLLSIALHKAAYSGSSAFCQNHAGADLVT